ncbi:unnamed protein product [Owenia fusiformis]|uniref:Uncharacterized protein n=1 Tax=Owenia fusiformis TaxID=6347 RepID=A0A8J1UER0_OWEFU|nr:unnamed protein product [Owenia fusiformis]
MRREFLVGEHSSGTMFMFWFTNIIVSIVILRSKIIQFLEYADNTARLIFASIVCCLVFLEFALHLFADVNALRLPTSKRIREGKPLLGSTLDESITDKNRHNPCPELQASFLSRVSFWWMTGFIMLGFKGKLNDDALHSLRPCDETKQCMDAFLQGWKSQQKRAPATSFNKSPSYKPYSTYKYTAGNTEDDTAIVENGDITYPDCKAHTKVSVIKALWSAFGCYYSSIGIFELLNTIFTYIRPLVLDLLISFVQNRDPFVWKGYLYASLLFLLSIGRALVSQQHFLGKITTGMRVRSALTAAIYRKALKLSNNSRKKYSLGQIINLMAVDSQKISDVCNFLHNIWTAPLNVTICMVLLWKYLGAASLAGLAALTILVTVNALLASKTLKKYQVIQMKLKDMRLKLTNELLNGIKVIKLYAWEGAFMDRVLNVRQKEIVTIRIAAFIMAGSSITFFCAPLIFAVISFSVYVLLSASHLLNPQVAFVSLTLVNTLSRPMTVLPNAIGNFVQAYVSVCRIQAFLNDEELRDDVVSRSKDRQNAVSVEDGSFSWEQEENATLTNVTVGVKHGGLTMIVGKVGSGKSSLISAMLGEMDRKDGSVNVSKSTAYVPQEAWIRNDTLINNILFGKKISRETYDQIIDACALGPDLKALPAGDKTEIGEKGINLSGGQKQRLSIARAVAQDANIYLLDDPLSAVDSHVGKHIVEKLIGPNGLLKSKTRILVTHGVSYLHLADQIVVMKEGKVSEIGTYQQLLNHKGAFSEFLSNYVNEDTGEISSNSEGNYTIDPLWHGHSILKC